MPRAHIDEREVDRIEAIIHSMTPGERDNPKIIDGSRRARIARGAGVEVSEVNGLVTRFFEARKMMAQMAFGMGLPGARRSNRSTKGKKSRKGKGNARAGRQVGRTLAKAAGMPGLPGGFGGSLGGGVPPSLPPGTELPDLSKLKFPKQ